MAQLKPAWMQAAVGDTEIVYSAQENRASVLASIFSREGVVDYLGGDLKVRQRAAGASYQIEVQAGRAAIRGDDVSDQGTYVVPNSTVATLTVPTSTSSQRTHQVVARVRDKLMNAAMSPYYDWTLAVLADTSLAAAQALPSAIVLATIVVPAGAAAVTTAMITDRRAPATVGTPDQNGTFTLLSAYSASDATRPLGWALNANGWVQLSGWFKRLAATTALAAQTQYTFTDVPVPDAIRPIVPAYRDFTIVSQLGHLQGSILPSGHLAFLSFTNTNFNQNAWISLDDCGWHL